MSMERDPFDLVLDVPPMSLEHIGDEYFDSLATELNNTAQSLSEFDVLTVLTGIQAFGQEFFGQSIALRNSDEVEVFSFCEEQHYRATKYLVQQAFYPNRRLVYDDQQPMIKVTYLIKCSDEGLEPGQLQRKTEFILGDPAVGTEENTISPQGIGVLDGLEEEYDEVGVHTFDEVEALLARAQQKLRGY